MFRDEILPIIRFQFLLGRLETHRRGDEPEQQTSFNSS